MTDVNFTTDETGNIVLTPEQHNLLLKGSREGIAISAGMDMDNPTSQLVLDQHWTPETTVHFGEWDFSPREHPNTGPRLRGQTDL